MGALTATCTAKGEEVHVLRSCASALGAIGKPATSALPVLREPGPSPARAVGGGGGDWAIETAASLSCTLAEELGERAGEAGNHVLSVE